MLQDASQRAVRPVTLSVIIRQELPREALLRCGHPTSIAEARDVIERYLEKARISKVAVNFTF